MDDKKNKKLPKSDTESEYPYNQVTQFLGGHFVEFNSTPDKESMCTFHPAGTYTEISPDGKKVHLVADRSYKVVSAHSSETVEGISDTLKMGGSRSVDMEDHHHEIGGNMSMGGHGNFVHAFKGTSFTYTTDSMEHTSEGGKFEDHNDGDYGFHTKDVGVFSFGKSSYFITQEEHGHFVQGNMDVQAEQKARLFSKQDMKVHTDANLNIQSKSAMTAQSNSTLMVKSQEAMTVKSEGGSVTIEASTDVTIKSTSKVVIQVGSSSIEVSSSGIKINASGVVDIQGASTKLQGGGTVSPPLTIT